ncbi:hypothetical protein V4890_23325 [Ralstonia solanacearum species complex bacterium KE056]|uniref:DUF7668 domain-containing protein n=1 Tax=Ralstonia solanacearum species complex bacterium KE056 TaxID=3119585 RepID=UPI002FC3316B
MNEKIDVFKDEDSQRPIPFVWRHTFCEIVEAFKDGDFRISRGVVGVRNVSEQDAARMAKNIKDYGAHLISLPEEAWETSACQWMRSYWDVLIDLFTAEEGASDLALAVRVFEDGAAYSFEIQSLYVP